MTHSDGFQLVSRRRKDQKAHIKSHVQLEPVPITSADIPRITAQIEQFMFVPGDIGVLSNNCHRLFVVNNSFAMTPCKHQQVYCARMSLIITRTHRNTSKSAGA
jgi:hypothetical protein